MVRSLRLLNFRNYAELELQLEAGLQLVTGPNAQGKTNLLEAIAFVCTGRLLRGLRDVEAIREGADRMEVHAELEPSGTELGIHLERGSRKRATLNQASLPRASDLIGRQPIVTFSNTDLPIIREGALHRRLFLDTELSQLHPAYLHHLTVYRRALDHRNALLKQEPPADRALLETWEDQLSTHGDAIRDYRQRFIAALQPEAERVQEALGAGETIRLEYEMADPGPLGETLPQNRHQDLRRGTTTVGPHRDDFLIEVGGRDARHFGSMGQQRTAALSLKLGVIPLIRDRLSESPLVLLDDVLSELDENRRSALLVWVKSIAGQVILTCNEPEQAGPAAREASAVWHVLQGTVTRA